MLDRQQFFQFKNKYKDQSAILFATGPSLKKFSWSVLTEKPDILVGVNTAIFRDDLAFDHYWCSHFYVEDHIDIRERGTFVGLPEEKPFAFREKIFERSPGMQVFCGTMMDGKPFYRNFDSVDAAAMGAIEYDIFEIFGDRREVRHREQFTADPASEPFFQQSIVFPPMQFLMYAGVAKIYLVGCDCGGDVKGGVDTPILWHGKPYKDEPWDVEHYNAMTYLWFEFSKFADKYYPAIEIISVNPLNLAGMFTDLYGEGVQSV